MRTNKIAYWFVALIAFALISCSNDKADNQKTTSKSEKLKVMFSWNPGPENAFLFYGIDEGIFDKLGIEINWIPSKGSSVVATTLANNQVDFGFISSDYVLVSKSKDFPIKAILTLYHETPVVIFSLKEKNIEKPEDIKGKRLGVLVKSAAYSQVISFLKENGISKDDFTEEFSKGSIQELLMDKVDAMMHYTNYGPPEMRAKAKKEVNEIKLSEYGINLYGTSIAVNNDLLVNNPDLVKRFVHGLIKSLEISKNNHDKVLKSLLAHDKNLDEKEMDLALTETEKMIYTDETESLGIGYMTQEGWNTTLKEINRLGNLDLAVDVSDVYDTTFIEDYFNSKRISQ